MRVGETFQARFEVRDTTGALAAADTATVTMTKPNGTTAAPITPTTPSLGLYDWSYVPDVAGRHDYAVRVTLGGVTRDLDVDVLHVDDPAVWAPLVSLTEAKKALNIPLADTDDDEELREVIVAASAVVERETRLWHRATVTDRLTPAPSLMIRSPVAVAVTSVAQGSTTFGASTYRLSPSGFAVIPGAGVTSTPWTIGTDADDVVVTYTAGETAVPLDVRQGVLLVVIDIWAGTQRGPAALPLQGEGEPDRLVATADYALPFAAEKLLRPWLKAPAVA